MSTDGVSEDVLLRLTTFGELLKFLRRRIRLTQDELAARVGYSRTQIAKLEAGERQPDSATVAARFIAALDLEALPSARARLLGLAHSAAASTPVSPIDQSARHNLPLALNSFIGRERELAEIGSVMPQVRLLTLTGAGGAGKSRLALQFAQQCKTTHADGVWLVELAALSDSTLVPHAVANVLGLYQASQDTTAALVNVLHHQHVLLILDNCEHLISACAHLAEAILQQCPRVQILATSREPLLLLSETVFRVPSLSLPNTLEADFETISESEAVQLFLSRVRAFRPEFKLNARSAAQIGSICIRLDGIPLAIELAANRARSMPLEQIAQRLDDRFSLLIAGSRTALPRQQTLLATLSWSYELLTSDEQRALRFLPVFVGGWTLDAAEHVIGAQAADLLAQLVSKSLIELDEHHDEPRYRILETIRSYAHEQLSAANEFSTARNSHLQYFAGLAKRARPLFHSPHYRYWFARFQMEEDNFRAAISWAVQSNNKAACVDLLYGLAPLWLLRGAVGEKMQAAALLIQTSAGVISPLRVMGMLDAAEFAVQSWDLDFATTWVSEAQSAAQCLEDAALLAMVNVNRGFTHPDTSKAVTLLRRSAIELTTAGYIDRAAGALLLAGDRARNSGDIATAETDYLESARLCRQIGDNHRLATVIGNLGRIALARGDLQTASSAVEQTTATYRQTGNAIRLCDWLLRLADIQRSSGSWLAAQSTLVECAAICRRNGLIWHSLDCLLQVASLAVHRHDLAVAATLLGAGNVEIALQKMLITKPHFAAIAHALEATLLSTFRDYKAQVQAMLDAHVFVYAFAQGGGMTLDEALAYAIQCIDA